jgi:hypothetical protein
MESSSRINAVPASLTEIGSDYQILTQRLSQAAVVAPGSSYAYVKRVLKKVDSKNPDAKPLPGKGKVLAPIGFISENLGADVDWDQAISTVTVTRGDDNIKLVIGQDRINVNGTQKPIDVPAIVEKGMVFVPLQDLAEALGKKVFRDDLGLMIISDEEMSDSLKDEATIRLLLGFLDPTPSQDEKAPVSPVDIAKINPADFTDNEIRNNIPANLLNFHSLANSVRLEEPFKGFYDLHVYRGRENFHPYNARMMEVHNGFAYFLATNKPWNPYYNSPQVRYRLELMMDHLKSLQRDDGWLMMFSRSEYIYGAASTVFAPKYLTITLQLLLNAQRSDADFVMPRNFGQIKEITYKALDASLTQEAVFQHGIRFSNQYCNLWSAGLRYATLFNDSQMERETKIKMEQSRRPFQSPAGYYYEWYSVDFNYNLETHNWCINATWPFAVNDQQVMNYIVDTEKSFYDWLAYTSVIEPDASGFIVNGGISGRSDTPQNKRVENAAGAKVMMARAFASSEPEHEAGNKERRDALWRSWPHLGDTIAFSAYHFEQLTYFHYYPTASESREARAALPYIAGTDFNHQRVDDLKNLQVNCIRRPGFYSVFNTGELVRAQQQFGLGFLWNSKAGLLIFSDHKYPTAPDLSWGTKPLAENKSKAEAVVYEGAGIDRARYKINGKEITPQPGAKDLEHGKFQIEYPLGKDDAHKRNKTVTYTDNALTVEVAHPGKFIECIPLMFKEGDKIENGPGYLKLSREGIVFEVTFASNQIPVIEDRNYTYFSYQMKMLLIEASGSLNYAIKVTQ